MCIVLPAVTNTFSGEHSLSGVADFNVVIALTEMHRFVIFDGSRVCSVDEDLRGVDLAIDLDRAGIAVRREIARSPIRPIESIANHRRSNKTRGLQPRR